MPVYGLQIYGQLRTLESRKVTTDQVSEYYYRNITIQQLTRAEIQVSQ